MARPVLQDYLQSYPFWLMDVAPVETLALPVFTPLSGFSSITSPEITVETQEINEGNWLFKRNVLKRADVSPITLQRGVTFANSDFWRWIVAAITGNTQWQLKLPFLPPSRIGGPTPRRQLVLIHYFSRSPFGTIGQAASFIFNGLVEAVVGGNAISTFGTIAGTGLSAALTAGAPVDVFARVPARAYVLHGCLPIRYKMGSDFDARSGEVSLAELDIKPELVEEISLTA